MTDDPNAPKSPDDDIGASPDLPAEPVVEAAPPPVPPPPPVPGAVAPPWEEPDEVQEIDIEELELDLEGGDEAAPDAPPTPGAPPTPAVPAASAVPAAPAIPAAPAASPTPGAPAAPTVPVAPDVPAAPAAPPTTGASAAPAVPVAPDVPAASDVPAVADVPATSDVPVVPEPEVDPIQRALEGAGEIDYQERLDRYLKEMEAEPDQSRKAVLCYEVGELQETHLGDEPAAIKSYSKALKFDNLFLPNLWAVRRVFWRRQLWPNLLKLLDAELKFVQDPAHRVNLLMEKGEILRIHQNDPAGALACYVEAHTSDPSQIHPVLILEKLYREHGNLAELFAVMRAHADASGDPDRKTAVLLSMARLDEQLADADYDRRRALLLEALACARQPERALYELERIASLEDRTEDVLDALRRQEDLYLIGVEGAAAAEDGEAAKDEATEDGESAKDEAAEDEAAEDAEAEDGDAAKDAAAEDGEAAKDDAAEDGAAAKDEAAKDDAAAEDGDAAEDDDPAQTTLLKGFAVARLRARLVEKHDQPDRAWEILWPWLERLPGNPVLLGELCGLAARLGRWGELAELLETRMATAEHRGAFELERALALSRAGRADDAEALLQAFIDADPPHLLVLSVRMLNAQVAGDAEALLALLDRLLVGVSTLDVGDDEGAQARFRSDVLTQKAALLLHDPEGLSAAEEACRAAREAVPGHEAAADLLEDIYTRESRWVELAQVYKEDLIGAEAGRALYLLESLADLQTVWNPDPEGLAVTLRQLTDQQPDSLAAKLRLADALAEAGGAEEELSVLEAVAEAATDHAELAADALTRAARIAEAAQPDTARAVELLGRALDLEPGQAEATAMLEQILRREERFEELATFYRAEAERTLSDDRIQVVLLLLGRLLERELARPAEAAEVYEQLWQRRPTDRGVLAMLSRALESAGEHQQLADVWEVQADATEDLRDKAELFGLLGEHLQDRLDDDARAEEAYLRARAYNPQDTGTLRILAEMSYLRRDWAKLYEVYDESLRAEPTAELRRRVLSELAWIAEGPLEDATRATDHWMELATLDPPVPTAFWAAARLAVGRREWGEAAGALDWLAGLAETSHEVSLAEALTVRAAVLGMVSGVSAGPRLVKASAMEGVGDATLVLTTDLAPTDGTGAAERLRRRIKTTVPEDQRHEYTLLLAWLHEEEGEVDRAAQLLVDSLKSTIEDVPLLAVLQHLADRVGNDALYADCCERLADLVADAERAGALYREGAERAGQTSGALRMLKKGLERDPEDRVALAGMAERLEALGHHAEADAVLGYHLGLMIPDEDAIGLRLQRAELRLAHLNDTRGAALDLHQILSVDPDHPVAQLRLATLLAGDGDYPQALELLERRADQTGEEDADYRRIQLLLAEVRERGGKPIEDVVDTLDDLLAIDAGDKGVLERKHAVLLRARQWSQAVEALDRRYLLEPDVADQAAGELRKAAIFRNLAANDDEARQAYEKARQLDPVNREAILGLCDLYRQFGDDTSLGYVLSDGVNAYRETLAQSDPIDPDLVRFLSKLFEKGKERDSHFFALCTLEALGEADAEEVARASQYRSAIVDRQPGRLSPDIWSRFLLHPAALGSAVELWDLIGEASYRIWPRELTDFGVGKGELVKKKNAAGVTKEIFSLASSLGIALDEVYVSTEHPDDIEAIGTSTGPALIVGSRVGPRLGAGDRHRVGCLLASLRLSTLALDQISEKDLEIFVAGAVRDGQPDYRSDLPGTKVDDMTKRIRKVLGRKERKALTLAGANYARDTVDLNRWRRGMKRTIERVGLLCSGDVKVSVGELLAANEKLKVHSEPVRDMMMFGLSDAHIEVRMTLGVAR